MHKKSTILSEQELMYLRYKVSPLRRRLESLCTYAEDDGVTHAVWCREPWGKQDKQTCGVWHQYYRCSTRQRQRVSVLLQVLLYVCSPWQLRVCMYLLIGNVAVESSYLFCLVYAKAIFNLLLYFLVLLIVLLILYNYSHHEAHSLSIFCVQVRSWWRTNNQ